MVDAVERTSEISSGARARVIVRVNEHPVTLEEHKVTGLEIKTAAIQQGVSIEMDFILVEELQHGRTRIVGDTDVVDVSRESRFTANSPDDNA